MLFLLSCTECGHELPEEAAFCPKCGTPVVPRKRITRESSKIEKLIERLKEGDSSARTSAIEELGEMGDARAVEPLINALKDRHPAGVVFAGGDIMIGETREGRRKVIAALGKIGDKRAVEPLIEALREDEVLVSAEAARALGHIGGARAVEALVKAVKEDRRYYEPSEELQLLGAEDVWIVKEAAGALGKIGEPAVTPLIGLLGEVDWMARVHVVEALVEIGDIRAVEPLIKALKHSEDNVVKAVVKVGGVRAVEPLIQALKDPDASVRKGAAQTLGMIGDDRAVNPLIEALEDEDEHVQREAVGALTRIGGDEAEKTVERFGKFPGIIDIAKVEKMERNRDVEGLTKVLTHKNSSVRLDAAVSLNRLGWKPRGDTEKAHYLIAIKKWDYPYWAKLREEAVEPLTQALKDENSSVRSGAAYALGEIGDARAVEPLNQAQKDEDSGVQQKALEALMKIEEEKIGKMEKKRDVEGLIKALEHEYWGVRAKAAGALGRIGDERAVGPLTQIFIDQSIIDHPTRVAVYEALKKIRAKKS